MAKEKIQTIYADSGVNIGLSVVFVIYSLLIIISGVWGYYLIPSECTDKKLRSGVRYIIVLGVCMATVYISYALCVSNCKDTLVLEEEVEKENITIVTIDSYRYLSNWFLWFGILASILSVFLQVRMLAEFKKLPESSPCKAKNNTVYNFYLYTVITVNVLVTIFLSFTLFKNYSIASDKAKERVQKQKQQAAPAKPKKYSKIPGEMTSEFIERIMKDRQAELKKEKDKKKD